MKSGCSIQLSYANIRVNSKNRKKKSGWQDSNLRPPRPKRGAITGLRYTPKIDYLNLTCSCINCSKLAERQGFEPWVSVSTYDDLANRSFRPLRHLSNMYKNIPLNADANVTQHFKERNNFFEFFIKTTRIFYNLLLSAYLSG